MKKINSDHEMLSAYIDNELLPEDVKLIEQKLKLSENLQKKYEELIRIKKLTQKSAKRIGESPYFETRLLANISDEKSPSNKLKKWIPVGIIAVVTICLMLILKFYPTLLDDIVAEQKTNLAGFYKENLVPLLFTADLTTEDIWNFAFYKNLPLDKTNNQYLQIGYHSNGEEFFEIKTAGFINVEDNFEKFMTALMFNDKQKKQVDSILESYSDDLQAQVLVNDRNTVAINPNLWNYHKAILADVLAFAEDESEEVFAQIVPAGYTRNHPEISRIKRDVKSKRDNEYIFVTPDTIFYDRFNFDKEKFKAEMVKMKEDLRSADAELSLAEKELGQVEVELMLADKMKQMSRHKSWHKNFNVVIDSGMMRVDLAKLNMPRVHFPNLDSIGVFVDKLTKNIKVYTVAGPNKNGNLKDFNFHFKSGDSVRVHRTVPLPNIDSIVNLSLKSFKLDSLIGSGFNFKFDSLTSNFKFYVDDSAMIFKRKEFEKEMKNFEKEMKKFRQEMNEMRQNYNNKPDSLKRPEKVKVIEI
jgi:hypothetical protein